MKSKQIFVCVFALAIMISCGKTVEQKVIVPTLKDTLTYNLDVKLEILKKGINFYKPFTRSGENIPMYFIALSIKNLSKDTFPICYMRCSFEETFEFEPSLIKGGEICDGNDLAGSFLLQNQRIVFQTNIIDPTYFWYLQNSESIRIGFHLKRIKVGDSFIKTEGKSNEIYWSNIVNLKSTLPSYHFHNERTSYLDSLDNKVKNYFRYPFSAEF